MKNQRVSIRYHVRYFCRVQGNIECAKASGRDASFFFTFVTLAGDFISYSRWVALPGRQPTAVHSVTCSVKDLRNSEITSFNTLSFSLSCSFLKPAIYSLIHRLCLFFLVVIGHFLFRRNFLVGNCCWGCFWCLFLSLQGLYLGLRGICRPINHLATEAVSTRRIDSLLYVFLKVG